MCVRCRIILYLHSPVAIVKAVRTSCITVLPVFHPLSNINFSSKDTPPQTTACCLHFFFFLDSFIVNRPYSVLHIKTCISLFSLPSYSCSLWRRLHLTSFCLQALLGIVLRFSLVVTLSSAPSYYHIDK